jgi:hypothetical protein
MLKNIFITILSLLIVSCGNKGSKAAAGENVQQDETQGKNHTEAEAIEVKISQASDLSLLAASLDELIVYPNEKIRR